MPAIRTTPNDACVITNTSLTPNQEDCLRTCQTDYEYCTWFTYFPLTRLCSLFATCDLDETQTDAVSGETDCLVPLE